VTLKPPSLTIGPNVAPPGVSVHPQLKRCETVKVCPPVVIVPLRVAPGFAAAVYVIVVVPEPELGLRVRNAALEFAVQARPGSVACNVKEPDPPVFGTLPADELSENAHATGAPACCTENVCPPAVIAPDRAAPLLAATE